MSIILGIDPGSRITGFGCIAVKGVNYTCLSFENLVFRNSDKNLWRMGAIFNKVSELIDRYEVDEVSLEKIFFAKNPVSVFKLGEARGAILAALGQKDVDLFEYSSREIKKTVVGFGAASKNQVQYMVKKLLALRSDLCADTADALAAAICHIAHRNSFSL